MAEPHHVSYLVGTKDLSSKIWCTLQISVYAFTHLCRHPMLYIHLWK